MVYWLVRWNLYAWLCYLIIEVADLWNAVLFVLLGVTIGGLLILVARFFPTSVKKSRINSTILNTVDSIKTMSFVPVQVLEKLLCIKCKRYLSHFPIYDSLQPLGSVCGRCPVKGNDQQNIIYEDLAKSKRFPCCYDSNGCTENLLPVNIPEHERYCYFRKYECPSAGSTNCKWEGLADELLDHFEKHHCIFLLISGEFEVDLVSNYNDNCLLNFENNLFIVNRNNNFRAATISFNVSYIGTNIHTKDYSYKITLHSGEINANSHVINNKLSDRVDIKRDFIIDKLNNPYAVIVQVEIIKPKDKAELETYEPVNTELLRELECSYCFEYMFPPIYQCITGHSICSKCKPRVTECPTCKAAFNNTTNIILGSLIEHFVFPCKNKGCKFTSKMKEMKMHEPNCIFGSFKCPLNEYENCECMVHYLQIYDHILNNHYENLLEMDVIHEPFEMVEGGLDEDCYIIRYGFQLFKLHYLYKEGAFYWALQLIGAQGKTIQYKFEIDVMDNFNNNTRVSFRASCSPLSNKATAFDDSDFVVSIDYQQIKAMITDEFSYRVRIISEPK